MKKLDFHVHVTFDITVEETIRNFSDMCERKGYEGVGIMTLWHHSDGYLPSNYNEISLETCVEKRISKGGTSVSSVEAQIAWVRKELDK